MAEPNTTPSTDVLLAALRNSRAHLVEVATPLTAEQVRKQSYDTEWSVGQVLSHLGTGAIFFKFILEAGLAGQPAPGIDVMRPIWDEWNAKSPDDLPHDAIEADGKLMAAFEALDAEQQRSWHLDFFGTDRDFAGILHMRLGELSVHTWDFVVALDPKAQLLPDAVDLLIDTLSPLVARVGKPLDHQLVVGVETDYPNRNFVLTVDADGATLEQLDARFEADSLLALPAEAFVRLVYGRLDVEHTPPGVDGAILQTLRAVFVGV
ncbi:MAG TPA: maleylpyruvate isomerase family mycothiol-dependent enzyme [Acidothermaceae bacterium]|nr:maleylpyruvate isomerase family mycothiol-dependent enzyme [Acidothermaceae bacterium]